MQSLKKFYQSRSHMVHESKRCGMRKIPNLPTAAPWYARGVTYHKPQTKTSNQSKA